jgi:hypothetical protein
LGEDISCGASGGLKLFAHSGVRRRDDVVKEQVPLIECVIVACEAKPTVAILLERIRRGS